MASAKGIGKIEIDIPKAEHKLKWTRLGSFLTGHDLARDLTHKNTDDLTMAVCSSADYIVCTVSEVRQLTHDTRLYAMAIPEGYHMAVGIGRHMKLKAELLGELV